MALEGPVGSWQAEKTLVEIYWLGTVQARVVRLGMQGIGCGARGSSGSLGRICMREGQTDEANSPD